MLKVAWLDQKNKSARTCPCYFCLLLAVPLSACGIVESTAQITPLSLPTTSLSTPSSTAQARSVSPPELATSRPIAPASPVPSTENPLPATATVTVGQLPATTVLTTASAAAAPTAFATSIPPRAAGAWEGYRNERVGYRVDHPANWTVSDQTNADGSFVTTFSLPSGGARITVVIMPGQIVPDNDVPNTRCEQVIIGGVQGQRCFDTISRSTSVTLVGQGKTFTIAPSGKHMDAQIFEQFLNSFAPL